MFGERDLHKSLKSEIQATISADWGNLALAKLAWDKDDIAYSLHVAPNTFSTSGIQTTDLLSYLGFSRQLCSFLRNECYAKEVNEGFDLNKFLQAFGKAYQQLSQAERHLENCGYLLNRPEGWGYFLGNQSGIERTRSTQYHGDGHTSAISPEIMKKAEDEVFQYIFTWIKNSEQDKGWTIHYHPKHSPLSIEIQSVFKFLGIKEFSKCPQFDFDPCYWRFIQFRQIGNSHFDSNVGDAHRYFDSHQGNFTPGIKALLAAQEAMEGVGMGFLPSFEQPEKRRTQEITRRIVVPQNAKVSTPNEPQNFDVAISFAGSERMYAEQIATKVKTSGFQVFYDDFYPEALWGKNLVEFFQDIYSKRSRFCVILVSNNYLEREWTIHERRSAQERMLKEKGNEYILPIKVDNVELTGIPSTIGYLPIDLGIDRIADILIKKLSI